uniref:Uncharacterized protein n=1 Tax=Salix viminalis TaxID=40686 RepID=A0A6N2KT15_SALVM
MAAQELKRASLRSETELKSGFTEERLRSSALKMAAQDYAQKQSEKVDSRWGTRRGRNYRAKGRLEHAGTTFKCVSLSSGEPRAYFSFYFWYKRYQLIHITYIIQ